MAPKKRGQGFTESDITKMVTNPIYAGVGPYPAMVSDEQWVEAVSKMIRERGAESVLRNILRNLRDAFPAPESQ